MMGQATCLVLGLALGLLTLAIIRFGLAPVVPAIGARIAAAAALPLWRRGVSIYVAAVGEEIAFRLLLLSGLVGLGARLVGRPLRATPPIIWSANAASALAFALAHLPAWSQLGPPSPRLVIAVLALNAIGGLVLGRIFVGHGVGGAMWAHAGADCALQVLGPWLDG